MTMHEVMLWTTAVLTVLPPHYFQSSKGGYELTEYTLLQSFIEDICQLFKGFGILYVGLMGIVRMLIQNSTGVVRRIFFVTYNKCLQKLGEEKTKFHK